LEARETRVLDAWDLQRADADRNELRQRVLDEFAGLLDMAGLPARRVVSGFADGDSGSTHLLVCPASIGEVEFVTCNSCGWAHDRATAPSHKQLPAAEAVGELQEVATPNCRTIADLSSFLGVPPARTAKALFLVAGGASISDRFVVAVVRGDTDLSEPKLGRLLGVDTLRPASEDEIRAIGAVPGYGSPVGLKGVVVVADDLIAASPNLVGGANRPGYHVLNTNCGRDYQPTHIADIAVAATGDSCPSCGSAIDLSHGVELARVGGCVQPIGAAYLDAVGESRPVVPGCHRFYIDRFIATVCETHHDELGLVWPRTLAPFDVLLLTAGKRSPAVDAAADSLYSGLTAGEVRVLFDDRDERAGVKFNDADLIGVPLRVVVGERGVTAGVVEVKHRRTGEVVSVPIEGLVSYVGALL
jgi:prolyl-tRNA synthetase